MITRKRRPLTPPQRHLLGLIYWRTALDGYPPSVRELVTLMGYRSTFAIADQVGALIKKGMLVTPAPKSKRTLALTELGRSTAGAVRVDADAIAALAAKLVVCA